MRTSAIFIYIIAFLAFGNFAHTQNSCVELLIADSSLLSIVHPAAKIETLDTNFVFIEGPVWHPDGFLLFSDIPADRIIHWSEENGFSDFLNPSANTNGLSFDKDNMLLMCSHGKRSVLRLDANGETQTLAHTFGGLKLNSPNDLVINKKGWIYFTDPCWGLTNQEQSPDKELRFNGVYLIKNDSLLLIDSTLWRPNGITLSPDQRMLYVSDMFTDNKADTVKTVYRYLLDDSGLAVERKLLKVINPSHQILGRVNGFDGLKTDLSGNIYCTGPEGIVILNADGDYLGTIKTPNTPANCAWGGNDYQSLFITARQHLYRIHLNVKGYKPTE